MRGEINSEGKILLLDISQDGPYTKRSYRSQIMKQNYKACLVGAKTGTIKGRRLLWANLWKGPGRIKAQHPRKSRKETAPGEIRKEVVPQIKKNPYMED